MAFLSPIWLIALLPWAALSLWLLWGRRERKTVPFLPLWPAITPEKRRRTAIELPPLALVAAMLAMLTSLLAAAGPVIHGRHHERGPVTIIVDRGITMSAIDANRQPRYIAAARRAAEVIQEASRIDLQVVPRAVGSDRAGAHWIEFVESMAPTAINDPAALRQTVSDALANTTATVVVISDQSLSISNSRVIQFAPENIISNVGIVSLSCRASPRPAAMVRVKNQSALQTCNLLIESDGKTTSSAITLPPRGQEQNYFVELPDVGRIVEARLEVSDDLQADHFAWEVSQAAWPIVEARSTVPEELHRMLDVFKKRRLPGEGSRHVAITASPDQAGNDPAAIIASGNAGYLLNETAAPVMVAHPVSRDVNWIAALKGAQIADMPAGNWIPLVTVAGHVAVAMRQAPIRQVWVGFESPTFARTPDFVVFWNNIFQWLGDGGDAYAWTKVHLLQGHWTRQQPAASTGDPAEVGLMPGLYQRADGVLLALNAPAIDFPTPSPDKTGQTLATLNDRNARPPIDLQAPALLLALFLLGFAAAFWQKQAGNP